jgi:hypothetical protein
MSHLLKDQHLVVNALAELNADGLADRKSLRRRKLNAMFMPEGIGGPETGDWQLVTPVIAADMTDPRTYLWLTAVSDVAELTPEVVASKWVERGTRFVSLPIQTGILHDIFGNPFHPITISPAVLTWNDAVVVRLAQSAYDERHLPGGTLDNTRLLILADALEETGCTDTDILAHLRSPGPHVRGCWVVDMLLSKE